MMMRNMNQMMKQVKKMQQEMAKAQQELEQKEVEGTAGGGVVKVKMNGHKQLLGWKSLRTLSTRMMWKCCKT